VGYDHRISSNAGVILTYHPLSFRLFWPLLNTFKGILSYKELATFTILRSFFLVKHIILLLESNLRYSECHE
jgi:hypothetical protein